MENVKFSIVIAVYNAGQTVRQAVVSVLQQTYADFEIILINDGSQDDSGNVCRELESLDMRIRYIEFSHNSGLSQVRNHGILVAKGEYIGFLDADDTLEPDALTVFYDRLAKHPVDILVCGFFEEYKSANRKRPICVCKLPGDGFYYGRDEISDTVIGMIQTSSFCYAWNKLYKKKFLIDKNVFYSKYPYMEDIVMNLSAFERCSSVILVDVPLYHYNRFVQFSLTTRFEADFLSLHQLLMDKEIAYFSNINRLKQAMPALTCQYLKLVFTALQMTFYKEAPNGIINGLVKCIYQYPHHRLFMSFVHQLPVNYEASLLCVGKKAIR